MRKNLIVAAIAFVCASLVACEGKNPVTGPTPTSAYSLTISLQGRVGDSIMVAGGLVTIFGETMSKTQPVDSQGRTTFSGLASGTYRVSGIADFGFENKQAEVTVGGNAEYNLVFDTIKYDVKFLQVSANGRVLSDGDTVLTPTSLEFQVQVMNPGTDGDIGMAPLVKNSFIRLNDGSGAKTIGPVVVSGKISFGLQNVTVVLSNFRPCEMVGGQYQACYNQSEGFTLLLSNLDPAGRSPLQKNQSFVLRY